jgi:hypothetical protein
MSSKSKQPKKKLSIPRPLDVVAKECAERWHQAGQVQYQIVIYQKELDKLNAYIERLNNEANARKQLDAEEAASKAEANNTAQAANQADPVLSAHVQANTHNSLDNNQPNSGAV